MRPLDLPALSVGDQPTELGFPPELAGGAQRERDHRGRLHRCPVPQVSVLLFMTLVWLLECLHLAGLPVGYGVLGCAVEGGQRATSASRVACRIGFRPDEEATSVGAGRQDPSQRRRRQKGRTRYVA